jgi:predicted GNAT family N-acyltransferase
MTPYLRQALPGDYEFAFEAKRDAMGPHIRAKWGWDDDFQRSHHARRWAEKPWSIICIGDLQVGTVSIDWRPTHMQFGEFYIIGAHRGAGLGTQVLRRALIEADLRETETRLEFLKWNPVGALYLRHGFQVVSESEVHFFATRPPNVT